MTPAAQSTQLTLPVTTGARSDYQSSQVQSAGRLLYITWEAKQTYAAEASLDQSLGVVRWNHKKCLFCEALTKILQEVFDQWQEASSNWNRLGYTGFVAACLAASEKGMEEGLDLYRSLVMSTVVGRSKRALLRVLENWNNFVHALDLMTDRVTSTTTVGKMWNGQVTITARFDRQIAGLVSTQEATEKETRLRDKYIRHTLPKDPKDTNLEIRRDEENDMAIAQAFRLSPAEYTKAIESIKNTVRNELKALRGI